MKILFFFWSVKKLYYNMTYRAIGSQNNKMQYLQYYIFIYSVYLVN